MLQLSATPTPARTVWFALLLALASPCLQAQGFVDLGAEVLHNDNLGRSAWNSVADSGLSAGISGGYRFQPGDYTGLTVQGSLQQQKWRRSNGMDTLDAGLQLQLSHKFGIGADKPVLSLGLAYTQRDADAAQRDVELQTLRLALQQRVLPTLQLQLDAQVEDSDGAASRPLAARMGLWVPASGKVWDFSSWSLGLHAELELGERAWLSGSWRFRDGPIVSTLRNYGSGAGAMYPRGPGVRAAGWDPAFGPMAAAYQLDARTRQYTLDYNLALFARATWYIGAEFHDSSAANGSAYSATQLRSGFLYAF